jgi:hypothetical protein
MQGACEYCEGHLVEGQAAPYGLCPRCYGLLEDELTDAAVRVGHPVRPDAETVLHVPLSEGVVAPVPPDSTRDAVRR